MADTNVCVYAKWRVKNGQLGTVLALLKELAQESRKEPGNLFYHVNQSNADSNTLILFEGYQDSAAQQAHQNSSHFQRLAVEQIVPQLEAREVVQMTPLAV